MEIKIPVYKPFIAGNEKKYVNECIETNWISSKGPFIKRFENSFAEYIGINNAMTVTNGTTALHLALRTLGITAGDEVIVPTFTYIATISAVIYTGATPVFVDSLPDTWQMDPTQIEKKINKRTKAIIAVHLYGQPADMITIKQIADKHKLYVIEDCAEAIGSRIENKHVGIFGDISAFSFYGNKTITTGEGGMLVTNNKTFYNRAYSLKMHCVSPVKEYWHTDIGYNYRMTNIAAAIGLAQLENIDEILTLKRKVMLTYNKYLENFPISTHTEKTGTTHSYWMYSILVNKSEQRDALRNYLLNYGIETRPTFFPIHLMPMFNIKQGMFPVAEDISLRGINLPSYPDLTESDIQYICNAISEFFRK
jgi:perosamine synthetase